METLEVGNALTIRSIIMRITTKGQVCSPLPDFCIGAHAAVEHLALLTRDARRYRDYFPKVEIIDPANYQP
jgi:predicted nucleic acid-binding protein